MFDGKPHTANSRPGQSGQWPASGLDREVVRTARAKAAPAPWRRASRWGAKPKMTHHQKVEAVRRCDDPARMESLADIGKTFNVSGWTIARLPLE
jgi:hypothetical protein